MRGGRSEQGAELLHHSDGAPACRLGTWDEVSSAPPRWPRPWSPLAEEGAPPMDTPGFQAHTSLVKSFPFPKAGSIPLPPRGLPCMPQNVLWAPQPACRPAEGRPSRTARPRVVRTPPQASHSAHASQRPVSARALPRSLWNSLPSDFLCLDGTGLTPKLRRGLCHWSFHQHKN